MPLGKHLRVLLVEDNETHAHLVRRHLQKAQLSTIDVQRVGTLRDAIDAIHTDKYDAVLLDLSLPDSDITETLGRFIDTTPNAAIIVLTSLNDLDFASKLVLQGADDFLVKSDIDSQVLVRSIRYAIERRKNKVQLAQYANQLEKRNEELKTFAHTVAHEVRSPLNIVSCCLTLIDEDHHDALGPDSVEAIADAKEAIVGMTELVTDLLEYSQVENTPSELCSVDMNVAFQEAISTLKHEVIDASATVDCATLPTVNGNPIRLRQLLRNLLSNALKYRDPHRNPQINVAVREQESSWEFSVSDNGLGMSPQSTQQVFAPFVRAHESTGIPGTGIGLSFCQRVVEGHGGRIWVESAEGSGSRFCFTLPRPK
ncbi:sensor histidine kinase [Stieleria varia]|uniref:histidine kinase n=1 Tax=Stieleria varia TaxID=2528005 RepID=A0A5C6AEF4_9BACT|nr:hybrid sensor histidine kinase/response regulator [Stieleria varia]TWT98354.1 Phytochrome-like protein cph1 [Stieleria varia]